MKRHLVFVVVTLLPAVIATTFIYDGVILCGHTDRCSFAYSLQFYDADRFSAADAIIGRLVDIKGPTGIGNNVYLKGHLNGDELLSTAYYTLAEIWHDCTDDRKRVRLRFTFNQACPIDREICHYKFARNVTNDWGIGSMDAQLL
ncbi:unnamed protein product [Caenorhabditis bovis]|uniref:Uncharacterized protein n=1 Tax=Caenorhabditis bovis TaxID=2654633 RepID=A0A8S1F3G0_9PELO|nr:unnamed protein product [Caenorhabditis bovis]